MKKQMLIDNHMPYLHEVIIRNILKRLPVKTLIRFQCVSNSWKTLIKSPSFVQEHLHHQSSTNQSPSLLIQHSLIDYPFCLCLLNHKFQFHGLEDTSFWKHSKLEIVGSCNGLLCLVDKSYLPPVSFLWNPATREVRGTPVTPIPSHDNTARWLFGFGFSYMSNDYKIVRISSDNNEVITRVEVFSLSKGDWRNIDFDGKTENVQILNHGVTVKGAVYWYGIDLMETDIFETDVIISFDLETEVFSRMKSPAILLGYVGAELAVYEDKLAVISDPLPTNDSQYYDLGVLEDEGWSLGRRYIFMPGASYLYATKAIWRNQIVFIDSNMSRLRDPPGYYKAYQDKKCGLLLIDITTNERMRFALPRYGHDFPIHVCNYVESLVKINNFQHIEEP